MLTNRCLGVRLLDFDCHPVILGCHPEAARRRKAAEGPYVTGHCRCSCEDVKQGTESSQARR